MGMILTWWVVGRWDEEELQCRKYTKLPATHAEPAAGVFEWLCTCTQPLCSVRCMTNTHTHDMCKQQVWERGS